MSHEVLPELPTVRLIFIFIIFSDIFNILHLQRVKLRRSLVREKRHSEDLPLAHCLHLK